MVLLKTGDLKVAAVGVIKAKRVWAKLVLTVIVIEAIFVSDCYDGIY